MIVLSTTEGSWGKETILALLLLNNNASKANAILDNCVLILNCFGLLFGILVIIFTILTVLRCKREQIKIEYFGP